MSERGGDPLTESDVWEIAHIPVLQAGETIIGTFQLPPDYWDDPTSKEKQ